MSTPSRYADVDPIDRSETPKRIVTARDRVEETVSGTASCCGIRGFFRAERSSSSQFTIDGWPGKSSKKVRSAAVSLGVLY